MHEPSTVESAAVESAAEPSAAEPSAQQIASDHAFGGDLTTFDTGVDTGGVDKTSFGDLTTFDTPRIDTQSIASVNI